MTWLDHLFVASLLIGLPAYAAWHVPRLTRHIEADPAYARTKDYLLTVALQWALTLALLAWWVLAARPFADLGLVAPAGRSWVTFVTAAIVAFFASQVRSVARSPEAQAKVRAQLDSQPSVRVILPTTPAEMRAFSALAVTAGVCEEILYRGYLLYYLRQVLPGAAAVAAAIAAFGLAHAYQGRRGIVLTGLAGATAMAFYLLTGSLGASIVLHATVDLANGFMAYRTLKAPRT
jgi:membrane protease YdiL (CAAX protease family)